ncbi:isoprenylcysteine carboxylmethyltransferase family protein [Candidatus Bathyarchaeota archaeon]|nr:isoprenylcysteine carboxylmethyltransferase family protein [Candidatus Bathyarchaeota archaeon]
MSIWFAISLVCLIINIVPYFLSLEHQKLERRYGLQKGKQIGELYAMISGWGFFIFLFGIWISPQERFLLPFMQKFSVQIPLLDLTIYLVNLLIFIPFFLIGAFFGIRGVMQTTLKVAEMHRTKKIITTGVYTIVRHPQYLGAILAHMGFSFLFSALYSLLITPIVIAIVYIISWKEEKELIREFGRKYENYKKNVPMLIPKI